MRSAFTQPTASARQARASASPAVEGDVDRLARFDAADEFAETRLGVSRIDGVHVSFS
jgi:hypothetical protein